MILKKGTLAEFAERVKTGNKRVIVYGAGTIGRAVAPYWIHRFQLDAFVLCYVDTDVHKQKELVQLGSRMVPVKSLTALAEQRERYILLVTVSTFEPVARFLERVPGTEDAEAFFLPLMLLDIAHAPKEGGVVRAGEHPLIPKKIHYCWFSGNPIPAKLQSCIDSWKRFCPDYEIIRWDENNYDVSRVPYMEQAYRHQKWGFIPDVARLDIVFRYGGIYLDTDVELRRSLDELLYQPAFCASEKWGIINAGGGLGAEPGNEAVRRMLEFRREVPFEYENGQLNLLPSGYYETMPLIQCGFQPDGQTQAAAGGQMTVYASEFFHPFDYMSGETRITKNTFSIHHFSGTWLGPDAAAERERTRARYQAFLAGLENTEAV